MILLRTYLVAFVLFISMGVSAQNIDLFSENNYSNNPDIITGTFKSSRIINGQSIENVGPGILDFRILHRFGPLSDGAYNFYGLDQATMRLGLDYGITDKLMIGIGRSTGTKLISASGHINKPGVYEIELGVPVEEFIYSEEYCGGIKNGKKLKAVVAGGSSVPILPADLILKTANGEPRLMSYESLADGGFATGTMLGSGGFIVMDEDTSIVKNLWNFTRFYHHESCGQCSPCREGTGWMEKILHRILHGHGKMSDIDLLWEIQGKIAALSGTNVKADL